MVVVSYIILVLTNHNPSGLSLVRDGEEQGFKSVDCWSRCVVVDSFSTLEVITAGTRVGWEGVQCSFSFTVFL